MHFNQKVYASYRYKLYKVLLFMKFSVAILILTLSTVKAESFGQRISLSGNKMSVNDLLGTIERQIPYFFVYDKSELTGFEIEGVHLKNVPLTEGLDRIFKHKNISYKLVDNYIVLKKLDSEANVQQNIEISGIVRNEKNEPIDGVTVTVKDKTTGAVTGADGKYSLMVNQPNETLIFKHISYIPQQVKLHNSTTANVVLVIQNDNLEEVVVVGYGTQKKINLTGAVSSISGKDLESRPITNIGRGLQGQMPGLTIRNLNTAPGSQAPQIRIRGVGTWGDANPLIVIDGIPGGDLNILNPDDIESISVLKDAASSSIYGVRGANGVIVVTTKTGKSGTPVINLNSYYGLQTPTALPELVGSVDYMKLQNEANINAGQNPTYSEEQIKIAADGSDPNYFSNTNWIDEVYRKNAAQQSHNFSMQGGGEKSSYYASYGYLGEGGLVVGDNFKANRHNARLRINSEVLDRIRIEGNLGYVDRGVNGSASGTGPLSAATTIRPLVPVRFTNGSWGYHGGQSNPVAIAQDGGTNSFTSQEITANVSATVNLMKGLDIKGQYGLVRYNSKRTNFYETIKYYSPDDNKLIYQTNNPNNVKMDHYSARYQTFIGTAHYNTSIKELHNITGLLGYSLEERVGNDFWASRQNLPVQGLPSLAIGTENQLNSSSSSQNALMSFFGRVNYDFDNKYLLEGNFRYDGSSRFHPDVRWNWFGAVSAGWVFSEERFFEDLKGFWNRGKVRFSYGTQGNDKVGRDFPYMATLESVQVTGNNPIGNEGQVGFRQSFIPNQLLTWESSEKTNIGLDLSFLSNKLEVTAEYFVNNTKNILLNPPLPDVIGVGTNYPSQNSGEVQNKGWEIVVGYQDQLGDFKYRANFNLSDVRNKITKLDNYAQNLGDKVRLLGQPLDAFYGFKADRIAQIEDFDVVNGNYVAKFPFQKGDLVGPGDLIYQPSDPNDKEITVAKDRHILGSDIPRYTYGFRGEMAYKNVDFSFFIQGVGKADGYLGGAARHAFIDNSAMPQKVHLDRWTPENTDASYPRLVYMRTHNTRLSSKWIEDASYLRLKNIQIGYTIPNSIIEKMRISKLRLYFSADNLFTKTDFYYGYDPEVPVGNTGGYYPQVKTFVFGLNVNLK